MKNTLMGTSFEYQTLLETNATSVTLRPVVEPVDTALAMEETRISEIRRQEYSAFAPVLAPTDATVQQVSFRKDPGVPVNPSTRSEALRRRRVEAKAFEDAPVEQRQAPLIAAPSEP